MLQVLKDEATEGAPNRVQDFEQPIAGHPLPGRVFAAIRMNIGVRPGIAHIKNSLALSAITVLTLQRQSLPFIVYLRPGVSVNIRPALSEQRELR